MSGYVRLHRTLIGHPAFRNDAEAMAFAWLTARASWQPCRVRYKGRAVELARGQLAISIRDFADAMDRDKAWVERLFKRLRAETMVETRNETGVTVITICNYDKYQCETEAGKTPRKTARKTDARQTQDTEQGREEGKEESNPPNPLGAKSEKTLLPEDWEVPSVDSLPPQARACAEQWTAESYAARAEEFVSFWCTRRRKMADWRLTWAGRVVALHSQVMRDQKFGNAPGVLNGSTAKPAKEPETLDELRRAVAAADRFGWENEPYPTYRRRLAEMQRTHATGPPRSIGQLAQQLSH